ncbi:hypothetical protein J2X61_004323 [Bacillus sp. 3255]|nr:hypothetical protein [Bacillus sp. 3255]
MQKRLASGFFHDTVWMERVLVGFAKLYLDAVDAYEAGLPCSPAWELAFHEAAVKYGFVLQDALLGINTHINNDLPLALYMILSEDQAWPDARIMLKQSLSKFILTHCRTKGWHSTVLLLDASNEEQWAIERQRIEHDAYAIGRKVAYYRPFRLMKKLAPLSRRGRWF